MRLKHRNFLPACDVYCMCTVFDASLIRDHIFLEDDSCLRQKWVKAQVQTHQNTQSSTYLNAKSNALAVWNTECFANQKETRLTNRLQNREIELERRAS